jgi:hypothetical protein
MVPPLPFGDHGAGDEEGLIRQLELERGARFGNKLIQRGRMLGKRAILFI